MDIRKKPVIMRANFQSGFWTGCPSEYFRVITDVRCAIRLREQSSFLGVHQIP
jgi:hypothetical protein